MSRDYPAKPTRKISDPLIQRFALRMQKEAHAEGYAAKIEGAVIAFVLFFPDGVKKRADLSIQFVQRATRRELDTEATRMAFAFMAEGEKANQQSAGAKS